MNNKKIVVNLKLINFYLSQHIIYILAQAMQTVNCIATKTPTKAEIDIGALRTADNININTGSFAVPYFRNAKLYMFRAIFGSRIEMRKNTAEKGFALHPKSLVIM